MENFKKYNASNVLEELKRLIDEGMSVKTRKVCNELSIFDWWSEDLTLSHMKQMKTFLTNAIRLGYTGYVCFKVGATGCANGMWAHKEETNNGFSPDGDCLYRSFSPDYTYWSAKINNKWYPDNDDQLYDSCKTIKNLEKIIENK